MIPCCSIASQYVGLHFDKMSSKIYQDIVSFTYRGANNSLCVSSVRYPLFDQILHWIRSNSVGYMSKQTLH